MKDILNLNGESINNGFSPKMTFNYNRELIKTRESRIKEWDFYQFHMYPWVLMVTLGHATLFGSYSTHMYNVETKEDFNFGTLEIYKPGKVKYPRNPEKDYYFEVNKKNFFMSHELKKGIRSIVIKGKNKKYHTVDVHVEIKNNYDNDKMVINTPFNESKNMFYLNYKEDYYNCDVHAQFGDFVFDKKDTEGLIDWGRGYWPFHQDWFWGNASAKVNGHHLGWNIGYGFGNLQYGTENVFFLDDKAYKFNTIKMNFDPSIPHESGIVDDDQGLFHLELKPVHDNYQVTQVLWVNNHCHQVFYLVKGFVVADGKKFEFDNVFTFIEHAKNQW